MSPRIRKATSLISCSKICLNIWIYHGQSMLSYTYVCFDRNFVKNLPGIIPGNLLTILPRIPQKMWPGSSTRNVYRNFSIISSKNYCSNSSKEVSSNFYRLFLFEVLHQQILHQSSRPFLQGFCSMFFKECFQNILFRMQDFIY